MAVQNGADDGERAKISAVDVDEGDRVFMNVHLHGDATNYPAVEYDEDLIMSGVTGEVVEALDEYERDLLDDGTRPMADVRVETDDGETVKWSVDNGYVIGYNEDADRRIDIGKFGGFYET